MSDSTSSQKTSCQTHKKCLTASFLATGSLSNYLTKFQDFSTIIQVYSNSMIFFVWASSDIRFCFGTYSKTCLKRPLSKRPKIGFQDQLSLNIGQKYYRMLQGEHSAILLTFIKLPFVIKIFVLFIFE